MIGMLGGLIYDCIINIIRIKLNVIKLNKIFFYKISNNKKLMYVIFLNTILI